ncbi:MAG: TonB-dependent receptor [Paludibacter sp.]|nr:TonB-dependent receptor [Paludibacter sp.]
MKQLQIIFVLFSFFTIFQISAESKNINDSIRLSELVVTGSKTEISRKIIPLSVSQVSSEEIKRTGQINILPTLNSFVPGIFVTERSLLGFGVSTGGAGSISIRGISSSPNTEVLILIDGHPQYQGIFGHPLPDAYVASDVDKVEIIRGPASILYGSNAMAGVINIITHKQRSEGLQSTWGTSFGSYNTQKFYGTLGYKKDKWNAFVSANHDQTDGIRENTDFRISNGYAKTGYEINKHLSLNADFNIAAYNANDNGSVYADPVPFNIDIKRGKAALSFDNKFGRADGSIKLYHNFGNHVISDGFESTDHNSGLMIFETFHPVTGNNLTFGTDLKQYGGKANSGAAANEEKNITEMAAYAYTQQTFFDKLAVSAGIRFENNSVFGNELIPMGGITYSISPNTTLKTSASKGFRSPTVMELYLYAANPDLKPESMMNYDISWLQNTLDNRLQIELTLFIVDGKNLIQVVAGTPSIRQNVGSFNNKGLEFSARYNINKHWNISGNYSYVNISKPVLAAPRQQANLNVNYHVSVWHFGLMAQHIDKLYTSIAQDITKNYTLLNARISAQILPQLEIFAMGNNLLNQKYEINYGYPMPGIYFNTGFNVRL